MPVHYATVLDAGSTGTRIIVYRWDTDVGNGIAAPLQIEKVFPAPNQELQSQPGIQEFRNLGARDMGEYLNPLLHAARDFLQGEGIVAERSVPIYLFATAGVRGLGLAARREILTRAWWRMYRVPIFDAGGLPNPRNGPFPNVRVISGKAEGLFAWIANNYGRAVDTPTTGIFEIGGASAQIAFAPGPGGQEAHTSNICLFSQPDGYQVYSRSWDGFGINRAKRTLEGNIRNDDNVPEVGGRKDNPCIPEFYEQDVAHFTGTGDFAACRERAEEVLNPELGNLPNYPDGVGFVGLATPMHSYRYFSTLDNNPPFNIADPYNQAAYTQAATTYCNGENPRPNDAADPFRFTNCFAAAWTLTMLRGSFPDPNGGALLNFPHAGNEDLQSRSSWTLGAVALLARHQGLSGCPGQAALPIDPFNNSTGFGDIDWPPIFLPSESAQPNFSDVATIPLTDSANFGIARSDCLTVMSYPTVSCLAAFSAILFVLVAFAYRHRRASLATGKIALLTDAKDMVV